MDDKRLISKIESKIKSFCQNNCTEERYELKHYTILHFHILEQSAKLNPCESCFLSNGEIKSRPQNISLTLPAKMSNKLFFYTYLWAEIYNNDSHDANQTEN